MRSLKTNLTLIMAFIAIMCILKSCSEDTGDKIKIPDFKTLVSQFEEPPAEYTTSPFFVWNAEITKEEIDRYLNDFKREGSSQVFIHPRPGLVTEYLSDKWFELFKYTVERGKELGMKIWIYDENSYPSGFAGGHVPAEMPESYNQGQGLLMARMKSLPDTAGKYFLILKEDNGSFTDITASLDDEKGRKNNYCLFSKTYNPKSDWYGGFSYVDLLYPGVTQKFIELTMSGYQKYTGDEFGKTIPGTFTDEPQIKSPGGIRYTPDLFSEFRDKWGYDLKTCLPSLYEEVGDWKKIRHNYTQTLLDMFIERWSKPWNEYCESKNLKFTGHYWEHEWPNMRSDGDNMALYIWHQVPAIDMLFNQFDDSTTGAQFGNIRSVKELASAANQAGRIRKLCETYGGSGWDLTFKGMKRNGDWEYALGVNLMNQHLTYFSMAGARKYDYPPSFDYHEPWWNDYHYINEHYARLSLALSSGRQVNHILVLEPTTTAWLYYSYVARNPRVYEVGQAFQSFIGKMEKNQVEYDLGSENIMKTLGEVRGSDLIVGDCTYGKVIIPPLTENLDLSTFRLLKSFVSGGGTLIAFAIPSLIDGSQNDELKEFFKDGNNNIIRENELTEQVISDYLKNEEVVFSDIKGGALYHHVRSLNDGRLIFVVNSSLVDSLTGILTVKGKNAVELNTLTGETSGYASETEGDMVSMKLGLPPAGSLLLFIPSAESTEYPLKKSPETKSVINSISPMVIKRDSLNVVTLDFCDITIGGETTRNQHVYNADEQVFKYFGFVNGNPWNHSVQYRTNLVDRDTFGINSGFIATYYFTVKGKFDFSSFKAVVERPWLRTVTINGTEVKPEEGKWWLDRAFGVFNIADMVREGENSLTVLSSPMRILAETEPVYILGDFSVEPAEKGWYINAPANRYTTGSWLKQGLPFYSWGMTYSKDFMIDNKEGVYMLSAGNWEGTVAEVTVNGQKAAIIAFPPYQADISKYISQGNNTIGIKVIGSLRNLLGPHHNNPPEGFASPSSWRNVKNYPPGKEYRLYDYGLMDEFTLLNEK
jgi:hypothetical protein